MKWIPRLCGATLATELPHWVDILYAVLNICGLRCLQSDNVSTPWRRKNKIVNSDKKRWFTFLLSGCFIRLIIKESYGGIVSDFTETRASLFQDFICKRESQSRPLAAFAHLHVEVFKRHSISPEELHRISGHKADSKETLHLVRAGPPGHLWSQREWRKIRYMCSVPVNKENKGSLFE